MILIAMHPSILHSALIFLGSMAVSYSDELPHRFFFTEENKSYYLVAVVVPNSAGKELSGFELYDSKDKPVQFMPDDQDLSEKGANYITGGIPDAPPVKFIDCNFDGYADVMMRCDLSPRFPSFEIWTWDSKQKKFFQNEALNDAKINRVDPKTKRLFAGGSGGHGEFAFSTYAFSPSGKLVHLSDDFISYRKNTETRVYYKDSKETKRVVTVPPPEPP